MQQSNFFDPLFKWQSLDWKIFKATGSKLQIPGRDQSHSPHQRLSRSSAVGIQDVNAMRTRMGWSYHPCPPGRPVLRRRPLWLRAARSLHRNGPVVAEAATLRNPRGPSEDQLGIAGGTGIGYGAAVHSYRLQAKQPQYNERKNKKHKGIGQESG